ncbi:GPM6A-like protein [Mya arenaria]|nr:GPM6A-like protein [Mya arenaria]
MEFTERLGNCPFASLIASIIVFVGVGLFCGGLYRALTIIIKSVMQELLEVLQIVFIVIACVMGLFAILLLIFAFLATGATRKNVYSGASCIMGGRISAAFFMFISYLLNLVWLVISAVCVIPIVGYLMVHSICATEVYSIYRNQSYPLGITPPGREQLCGHTELRRFCDKIEESGPMFCVALVGSVLICLGMLHFMISLAANYTRIRISKELTDYRDAVDMEELELHSAVDKGSSQY